jgi:putative redox protein
MQFQKLSFQNAEGERLAARLDLPVDGRPVAYALFAHCFTCTKNLRAVNNISRGLTGQRIAVLRFDFTGLGESEGDFAETNFSSNVADLVAAANFLAHEFEGPQILIGHSLGGAAVLQAAGQIPSVRAVVTIGAPSEPTHVTRLLASARETIEASGEAEVAIAGRTFRIKKQFLDDLDRTRMESTVRNLRRPLLVLHSPLDTTVGINNAAELFQAAKHPKSFISLDKADHLLSKPEDSLYVGSLIPAWVSRYLEPVHLTGEALEAEGKQTVVRTGQARYYTEILAHGHGLVADEPVTAGGTDMGPSPYGLLTAALGACTSITLRMYADRKGWPLEAVTVRLNHEKIHAEDCENCETERGKIDRIEREVELIGPLNDKQRARLKEVADRCPVHRTLHSEIVVETTLKPKESEGQDQSS